MIISDDVALNTPGEDSTTPYILVIQVSYLSTLGGRDLTNETNINLRSLLTNEVAQLYSYRGTRLGKRALSTLNLKTVVVHEASSTEIDNMTEYESDIDITCGVPSPSPLYDSTSSDANNVKSDSHENLKLHRMIILHEM
ncbi:hypothetical protein FQA39_LY17760 [Lamprigera yunnana]|nr:hypothetical protein FQA39_LY17760 [Lamprigera yunnana]